MPKNITYTALNFVDDNFQKTIGTTQLNLNKLPWAYIDLGFSIDKPTTGLALNNHPAIELSFSDALLEVTSWINLSNSNTVCIAIEAPLSVAFSINGNPLGRNEVEKRSTSNLTRTRYWYQQPGATVFIAAHRFLDQLSANSLTTVILFEGFISYKPKINLPKNHAYDADSLRNAINAYFSGIGNPPVILQNIPNRNLFSLPSYFGFGGQCPPPPIFLI